MKRALKFLVATAVLALIAAAVVTYLGLSRIRDPYMAYAPPEVFVDIPTGSGPSTIGQRLVDAGVVRDALTFRIAVWVSGHARDLKAGEYQFDRPMSALDVVDKLARGEVYRRAVTFREGLTIAEMASVYEEAGLGRAADFLAAARDPSPIRALDPGAPDLEGYLFPETYQLRRDTPAADLIAQMVARFEKTFSPALREAARARGLTVREAVTVASLVEKETAVAAERPIVAAVYLNRKRIGMPMQADPTVIFALQRAGSYTGNLRRDDLQVDSPYNTYRYPGLPPGPIAAPGKAALEATVAPADVDYLYFVSRNDGSHVFARTLSEHNRNVQEWQVEYFRRKRLESGR
jgi:UPF0755 protein